MSSTKKTPGSNDKFKAAAENIMLIKQDTGARELNQRLRTMETELHQLLEELSASRRELQHSVDENHSDTRQLRDKINKLEQLQQNLETKVTALTQAIELRHKNLDSRLEQVGRNFTFHDTKILSLHKKTTELENSHNSLKTVLQQTDSEHQALSQRTTQIEDRVSRLSAVDEELGARAESLRKTTQHLDEHSDILEKTTVSLRKHSHELQRAVTELDKQNEQLEDKTDELGMQIAAGVQSERQHFQTLSIALSVVAVVTLLGLVYSYLNQQSLWQSGMDNDVVIERRVSSHLSEQNARIKVAEQNVQRAEQQRLQLAKSIELLQTQLKSEREKSAQLLTVSEQNREKISHLDNNLKTVDDNVQYLNSSVGPLKNYSRNSGRQVLHAPSWLAQQTADNYSIQLLSVNSRQDLYRYIEKYGYSLQDSLAWFTIKSSGQNYYVLTYGSFKDLAQARAVFKLLPAFMTASSPGVTRMKDIQHFIL